MALAVWVLVQDAQLGLGGVRLQPVTYCGPVLHESEHDEYMHPIELVPPLDAHSSPVGRLFMQSVHAPADRLPQLDRYCPTGQLLAKVVQLPVQPPALVEESMKTSLDCNLGRCIG